MKRSNKSKFIRKKMQRFFEKNLRQRNIKSYSKIGKLYFFTKENKYLICLQCCSDYTKFDFKKKKETARYCSFTFALISTDKKIPDKFKEKLKRHRIGLSFFNIKTKQFSECFLADINTKRNVRLEAKKLAELCQKS